MFLWIFSSPLGRCGPTASWRGDTAVRPLRCAAGGLLPFEEHVCFMCPQIGSKSFSSFFFSSRQRYAVPCAHPLRYRHHAVSYVSSYCFLCVLIILYMRPHTAMYACSYCCMCPHTAIYVSSYSYICVLILLYVPSYCSICVHILVCMFV